MDRRTFIKAMGAGLASASGSAWAGPALLKGPKRPNILWIAVEDISPLLSCYGYGASPTPHLDRLAAGGVRFERAFMPAPVCSPCRSGMITGLMPTSTGTHNHHSSRNEDSAIHLPKGVETLPELFRQAGYFTFNHGKDDYNFRYDRENLYTGAYRTHRLYGCFGDAADWRDRPDDRPFFGQIQLKGGKHIYKEDFADLVKNPVRRDAFELPPYYPDDPMVREDWARHIDSIRMTDDEVGAIVERLRADGLLDNTVICFFSDHGMRLWRHKQFCYDSGLQVPFIMSWAGDPGRLGGAGTVRRDLISGLDLGATSLALAGLPVPEIMESRDLFAAGFTARNHVIGVRDRCDFTIDRIRTVRTDRYRYIRNFHPERPYMQPSYRDDWDVTARMRTLHAERKLNEVQDRFWGEERPAEELYDLKNDPHEIHNLARDPARKDELHRHRRLLADWICETGDQGQYPEDDANLQYMLDWWGERCVNPEYDRLRKKHTPASA